MTFAEDAARLLGKPPRDETNPTPEAARQEALVVLKRGESAFANDPKGDGARAALVIYLEALDLDPTCKPAYEAVVKVVLARAEGDRPTFEGALRFVAAGQKRLPTDPTLRELERKLRSHLLVNGEPALAVKTTRASDLRPMAGHGAGRVCKYCQSPIPVGAPDCRSCSMSGEMPKPGGVVDRAQQTVSPVVIVAMVALFVVVAGGVAIVALRPKPAPATPTPTATKKP